MYNSRGDVGANDCDGVLSLGPVASWEEIAHLPVASISEPSGHVDCSTVLAGLAGG